VIASLGQALPWVTGRSFVVSGYSSTQPVVQEKPASRVPDTRKGILPSKLKGGSAMFRVIRFKDRFALSLGIYCGSWGVHIYLDFWQWCLSFESKGGKSDGRQRLRGSP